MLMRALPILFKRIVDLAAVAASTAAEAATLGVGVAAAARQQAADLLEESKLAEVLDQTGVTAVPTNLFYSPVCFQIIGNLETMHD